MATDRPRKPARISGQWPALALAIAVHVAFIGVLVFSVRWQNRKPEPVTALLYAPPSKTAVVEPAAQSTPPEVKPEPAPVKPEPAPAKPVPAPIKPEPLPPKKVEPRTEAPDTRAAQIAEKAKKVEAERKKVEEERKKLEQAAKDKKERDKKVADQREAEKKKKDELQRLVETRERQAREADALRAQAEREQAVRAAQQKVEAEAAAHARAEADYIRRIQTKVRGNVILPPDMAGNPEAIFDVIQLPTGEIIDAVLRKSSGSRPYDDAVARAIVKASPLPRPERPDLFQRTLTLKFRPQD